LAYLGLPAAGRARLTPVVVLHGGPGIPDLAGDAAFFGPLTALGYDVHLYEQLGAGGSARLADPTGYGIDRDVDDLEQVRVILGADRMILLGHSYGATLAAHYLAAHPDRVDRLVLSSPVWVPETSHTARDLPVRPRQGAQA
jgi:proline iminopeptidase